MNNLIPIMTSNTTPSGIASASGYYDLAYNAFKAFDHINSSIYCWYTNNIPTGWLQYKFTNSQRVVKYLVTSRNISSNTDLPMGAPKSWTFEGSNDGTNFNILDTQQNITDWISDETKEFTFNNINTYLYYKINISASNSTAALGIGELQMFAAPNKFLIKQGTSYYSIKPEFYNNGQFTPLILSGGDKPNDDDYNNQGFDDINTLCTDMTVSTDTFKPIDKVDDQFQIKKYIPNS
mgnify:CR=1 FL=1